jgi:hypothetical protein
VQAIEMMKAIAQYAQQGFTAAANDECMIAYQQDTGVMGLQWASRAKAMDDPNKSRVVGKIDWTAPPQGHGRNSGDGYAISAFSKQDPDTLFRIIATWPNGKLEIYIQPHPIIRHMSFHDMMDALDNVRHSTS